MTEVDENLGLIEEYIRNLPWSEDTPDIHKTLVAGNIRSFYAWSKGHLTPRAADICPRCEGTGKFQRLGFAPTDCAVCNGTGKCR